MHLLEVLVESKLNLEEPKFDLVEPKLDLVGEEYIVEVVGIRDAGDRGVEVGGAHADVEYHGWFRPLFLGYVGHRGDDHDDDSIDHDIDDHDDGGSGHPFLIRTKK